MTAYNSQHTAHTGRGGIGTVTAYNSQHTAHTGRGRDRYCDGLQQSAHGAHRAGEG